LLGLVGPSRDLAVVQQNLGAFCVRIGEYAEGEAALSAAAMHWRVVGDPNGLALSQINLGDLHLRIGNLDPAGRELTDAIDAARTVGSIRLEGHATVSLGQWHRASGRLLDAVGAFDEGIRLAEEAQERELLSTVLVLRAEVALLQGDSDMARTLLARAQAEAQRLASNTSLALVDRALGRLHLLDGAGERAVRHLESALDRAGDAWGSDQKVETLYWLGTAYLALGRAQQASAYLEQAVLLCDQANLPTLLARPAAEDNRLLRHGREAGLSPVLLAEVERIADMRTPWTGVRRTPRVEIVAQHELPRVEVQLFGPVVVHRDGELLRKQTRKVDRARELLALLILHPNGLEDSAIAEQMWPEMPPESALHNLQMAAYSLRNDLGSKAAVRYGAHKYQLNPQLELVADVRTFDTALARARGAAGDTLVQNLSRAVEVYRDPLLADAAWPWAEPVRLDYRARYVAAALHLAHLLAPVDAARSDGLAEGVLAVAPEIDSAYEQLIVNARRRSDDLVVRRLIKRYEAAAAKHRFAVNPNVINPPGNSGGSRASRGS
jgi:DNA-binding SARP family transcriptional activator/tetratricopeptide (TPR) repeat protein